MYRVINIAGHAVPDVLNLDLSGPVSAGVHTRISIRHDDKTKFYIGSVHLDGGEHDLIIIRAPVAI